MLVGNPSFSAIAVIVLALAIGANTAIFSTIDALVLHPLNFSDLESLVEVSTLRPQQDVGGGRVAVADFADWRKQQTAFEDIAAHRWHSANLSSQGEPERVFGFAVTPNFFQVLRADAAIGRTFLPEEGEVGRDRVVVLSYNLWQRRFGGDPAVVSSTIQLDGRNFTVIGVMPKDCDYPRPVALWIPMALTGEEWNERRNETLTVIARLKSGVALAQANAEMTTLAERLSTQYPQTNTGRSALVTLLRDSVSGDYTPMFLWLLMAAVASVLAVACVNIANMQLARTTSRFKEFAIRAALGASRRRIIQQLLTESVMLSIVGGLLGLACSYWFLDFIRSSVPSDQSQMVPGWSNMGIQGRVVGFNIAITFMSGIIFGLVPAFHISRPDLNETLKDGGRGSSKGVGQRRLRSLLVVSEVALALVLLIGSGLIIKGFSRMAKEQVKGFDPTNVLTLRTSLPQSEYATDGQINSFYQTVLERITSTPGVASASVVGYLPASDNWDTKDFRIEGRPDPLPGELQQANFQAISEDYFQTMRIPLTEGRAFSSVDGEDAPRVAIISEGLARRYWPDQQVLGQRIRFTVDNKPEAQWFTVVGVVGDVRRFMFDGEMKPTLYVPYRQVPEHTRYFTLRTIGDPASMIAAVRAQIAGIDPDLPLYEIRSQEKVVADQLAGIQLSANLMAMFGLMALLLSAIGVYGVMSYSVSQRIHEIGVRLALGAQPGDVRRMVTRQALKLTGTGLAIGLPVALGLGRVMASALFGVVSLDLTVFAAFTLALAFVAFLSSYLPARRASKVDPIIALRYE
jgi:putative ABC transport system permease protein